MVLGHLGWLLLFSLLPMAAAAAAAAADFLDDNWTRKKLVVPFIWTGIEFGGLFVLALGSIILVLHYIWVRHNLDNHGDQLRGTRTAQSFNPVVMEYSFPVLTFPIEEGIGSQSVDCSICLEDFVDGESVRALPVCGHIYHPECFISWLISADTRCPKCRHDYAAERLVGTLHDVVEGV